MTPEDLAIRPSASREEAAAIAAAIHAHEARRSPDDASTSGWGDRRWRLAARLAGVGREAGVRGPVDAPAWRLAARTDPRSTHDR